MRQLLIEARCFRSGGGVRLGLALVLRSRAGRAARRPSPITFDLAPNGHILAFTSVVAIATGILFSLAPACDLRRRAPSTLQERTRERYDRGCCPRW